MAVLVTGGAGYIGSHTVVELILAGYDVVIVDNLSNSSRESIERIKTITGKTPEFYHADILDRKALREIFAKTEISCCIHFAGLKAVGESVEKPWEYYHNNILGTLTLVDEMRRHGVKNLIFSSSATVYGDQETMPLTEASPLGTCSNPYGFTKAMQEQILRDIQTADREWNVTLLRYFNPIGAHPSGLIGEDPRGIPNNLLPYITQVAVGRLPHLGLFGDDYDTPDGTCIRDYIHVVDLAIGHLMALRRIEEQTEQSALQSAPQLGVYNLGTGNGYSVLEVIAGFTKATGIEIPWVLKPRRSGDLAVSYANADKAWTELGWEATYDIHQMCAHAWNWQSKNPNGYE
ncbi:MAG: UDP-glucose 4-epimerase GalE [Lachnospiraceae bacterium]|jgi:UDP-glucose 4-epimerase|nr:UDP-glucose 4-epimerase GalE [Lachnospiraceae bacterium]